MISVLDRDAFFVGEARDFWLGSIKHPGEMTGCPIFTLLESLATRMCRWRQVQNNYAGCGHAFQLNKKPDQEIQCDSTTCKFSPSHPRSCGPNCTTTCWQYRQFPEQFVRTIQGYCPQCTRGR
ncbi:hypothetical protein B0H10DRAFT_852637 [Mycena sp. CBHHK59/15]|nr:hypothetical protein B0H10DRAFT_852637 [Mycena sp. CBHHK59/15]